jgi:hypothetical protein
MEFSVKTYTIRVSITDVFKAFCCAGGDMSDHWEAGTEVLYNAGLLTWNHNCDLAPTPPEELSKRGRNLARDLLRCGIEANANAAVFRQPMTVLANAAGLPPGDTLRLLASIDEGKPLVMPQSLIEHYAWLPKVSAMPARASASGSTASA